MQTRRPHFEDHSSKIQRRTDLICRILTTLDPETGFKLLATNVLPELITDWNEQWVRKTAGELARRPFGDKCDPDKPCPHKLLDFHVFSGKNPADVRHYFRTEAGDKYLRLHGYSASTLRYRPHRNPHQALVDLWKASLKVGVRSSNITYKPWHIFQDREMPAKHSDHPGRLYLDRDTYYVPDDLPFSLSNQEGGTLCLLELDRNSENLTAREDKITIGGKIIGYRDLIQREIPQKFYAVRSVKILFVTTSPGRQQAILRQIAQYFPNGCHFIMVGLIEDHIKEARKPNFNTNAFTQHYLRHNHPPFSLKTLSDV